MRGIPGQRVPAAGGALIQQRKTRVQVIAQRDGEEKQHQPADYGGPFADGIAAPDAVLVHPTSAPGAERGERDHCPHKVKE